MLKIIIEKLFGLFKAKDFPSHNPSELEKYIISKNPQSIFDVEYWTNEFDKRGSRRSYK